MNNKELTIEEYREKVSRWLRNAKARGNTHVIVAIDMSRKGPFPTYVSKDNNVQRKIKTLNDDINTTAVEVYNMSMDLNTQLLQGRAWNV